MKPRYWRRECRPAGEVALLKQLEWLESREEFVRRRIEELEQKIQDLKR